MRVKFKFAACLPAVLAALIAANTAVAQTPEQFYRGKTITMIIGFAVAGSLDAYGRLAARHLGNHIPGRPTIVVQNMPGASGLTAANYLYHVAAKDGTVLGVVHPNSAFAQVIGLRPSIKYDARKFNWVGRLTSSTSVFYTWHTSATKTLADLMRRETVVGGIGPLTDGAIFSRMTNHVLGTKIKVIQGYKGTAAANAAMEGGELEGLFNTWEGMKSFNADWIRDKKINLVAQYVTARHPELPDVPAIIETAKTDEQRQVIRLFLSVGEIGRHVLLPPDVPADRVAAIRAAFVAMLKDPAFLADAKKAKLELNPLDGAGLQQINVDTFNVSAQVVATAQSIMKN
ncbi:MAG: Bug family tripartite tricarboxylate transporter substrate binding protein [Xanthobacteraceae bacterium]